jgi:PAS domain S-box-containing protein
MASKSLPFGHNELVATADEGERLYRLLVETVRDYAIFALDPTGHIVTWNAGARRIKGYTPEEIIGQHFSIFYPPADVIAGKPDAELIVAARDGRFEDEGWRIRKDGSRFWANVVITALYGPAGEVVGFGKVTRDLTERRRVEEQLAGSEERLRLLVQSVTDYALFMLDPRGCIVSWNDGAQRMKGYTTAEVVGQHFSLFYPADEVEDHAPERELQITVTQGRHQREGWRIRKDGTRFWANIVITSIRNRDGELIGFAKITRDLTDQRAAQDRAIADARRVAEAESANRAKGEFLAAMSHELRTPLNAIGGYVDLLDVGIAGPLTPQQRAYLERVRGSQQHLLGIINDLLNYSRIEAGQLTYHTRHIPLGASIDAAVPMISPQAAMRHLTIERAPCDAELVAWADRAKVDQILLNILSNAIKYTLPGGRITISCGVSLGDPPRVTLSVQDTGLGIPEEKLESIFEPFVQVGRSLTSTHEGTGLGLAISRDLARAMGGDLTVTSHVGHGSTFTLLLPVPPSPEPK